MVTRKMRVLATSLALVLCVSLYSVPKAKAVATEVAVGTAAVASYFQATGLTMAASAGATGALVTTGVADIAGSYAVATGAASSGSAFLSSLAAGVSISPAGAIVLTAAAVVAIGALVAWYVGANELTSEGDSSVLVPGVSDFYSYNGLVLPDIDGVWIDKETYPFACIIQADGNFYLNVFSGNPFVNGSSMEIDAVNGESLRSERKFESSSSSWGSASNRVTGAYWNLIIPSWTSFDLYRKDGTLYSIAVAPVPVGDNIQNQLEVFRTSEFTQPDFELDVESQKQMVIDAGFAAGTTLDTVATEVPELIAAGTMAPTYEITTTETGGDTGTETEPEEETAVVPWLERIHTTLTDLGTTIADKITDGLQSLFVPDEAFFAEAVPELQETFQGRMGLLTFPISLLADFLGRLLNLADQEPILRWNSVSIYGTELIAAGQYNLNDALKSAPVKQMHDIYMVVVNAILIFAFLGLCHNKYRKVMQN